MEVDNLYVLDPTVQPCPEYIPTSRPDCELRVMRQPSTSLGHFLRNVFSAYDNTRFSICSTEDDTEYACLSCISPLPQFPYARALSGGLTFYGAETIPSERRKGMHVALQSYGLAHFYARGQLMFSFVAADNTASNRTQLRAGFYQLGYVRKFGYAYRLVDEKGQRIRHRFTREEVDRIIASGGRIA